jgi:hypothetical protein
VVGNDGLMGLRRIWTISHGHLDHSRDCRRGRYRVAPTNGFLVMCWRPTEVGGDITDTGRSFSAEIAASGHLCGCPETAIRPLLPVRV